MNAVLPFVATRVAVVPALLVLALACAHQADDCTETLTCDNLIESSTTGIPTSAGQSGTVQPVSLP